MENDTNKELVHALKEGVHVLLGSLKALPEEGWNSLLEGN